jgi:hypothetical protein
MAEDLEWTTDREQAALQLHAVMVELRLIRGNPSYASIAATIRRSHTAWVSQTAQTTSNPWRLAAVLSAASHLAP